MIDTLRLKLATWLAPSLKNYKAMFEGQLAETVSLGESIARLKGDAAMLTQANDDARDRVLVAALRIAILRSALKKAMPYVIDAVDEIDEQLARRNLAKASREALTATREAVHADLDDVRKVYLGKSSADAKVTK